jgi:hypothetical protein
MGPVGGICSVLVAVGLALSTVACEGSGASHVDPFAADVSVIMQDAAPEADAHAASLDGPSETDSPADAGCPFVGFSCPVTPPDAGAPCSGPSEPWQGCEYGDDPDPYFNSFATCVLGSWNVPPAKDASAFPPVPAGCPATLAAALASASCDPDAAAPGTILACYYPGGACICGPPWSCTVAADGCPAPRPRIGSPCTPPMQPDGGAIAICSYTPDFCGAPAPPTMDLSCSCDGRWVGRATPLCNPN